jgi:hypothetical protein
MEASWQKVMNSPLNMSKSKMLYSFSRTKRFGSTDSRSSNNSYSISNVVVINFMTYLHLSVAILQKQP